MPWCPPFASLHESVLGPDPLDVLSRKMDYATDRILRPRQRGGDRSPSNDQFPRRPSSWRRSGSCVARGFLEGGKEPQMNAWSENNFAVPAMTRATSRD